MIRIVVISLERRSDRRKIMEERIAYIGLDKAFDVEFVAAIDGFTLSQEDIAACVDEKKRRRHFSHPLSSGALGCAMSHNREIKRFLESDDQARIILEDDCDPFPAMCRIAPAIERLHSRVDIINLNDRGPTSSSTFKVAEFIKGHDLCMMKRSGMTTIAYVITRRGARKYLATNSKISHEADRVFNHWWRSGFKIFTIEPPLARYNFNPNSSDVDAPRIKWSDDAWHEKITRFINRQADSIKKRWKFRAMCDLDR